MITEHSAVSCHRFLGQNYLLILDVRTPQEYESGHLKGAVNIPIQDPSLKEKLESYDKGRPVLVYCKAGIRSRQVINYMESIGYQQIHHMTLGINDWNIAGYELITGGEE
jgi:phage shock protein E